jgi:hypothetical protein
MKESAAGGCVENTGGMFAGSSVTVIVPLIEKVFAIVSLARQGREEWD